MSASPQRRSERGRPLPPPVPDLDSAAALLDSAPAEALRAARAALAALGVGASESDGPEDHNPDDHSPDGTTPAGDPSGTTTTGAGATSRGARARFLLGAAEYRLGDPRAALTPLREAHAALTAEDGSWALQAALELGRVERELGCLREAVARFQAALALARALDDPGAETDALNLEASVLGTLGEYADALACLEGALALARRAGLEERRASVLNNLGNLHAELGDYPRALERLTEANELVRAHTPGGRAEATNLISLGYLYRLMGDSDAAGELFNRARELGRDGDDRVVEVAALNNLANVQVDGGHWGAAEALFGEALATARLLGVRQYEIDNLDGLGQVHAALGDHARALDAHREALAIARDIGDHEGELDALLNLGRDELAVGRPREALEVLREALTLAGEAQRKRAAYEAHELLSEAHERCGDLAAALRHHRDFHRLEKQVFDEEKERHTRKLAVQFELERARHEAESYRLRTEIAQQAHAEAEARVRERTRELEEAQLEIVTRLAVAAEFRDDDTGEHTLRVGHIAATIAETLGWSPAEVQLISSAARLHDVGKIGIPDAVLLKPDGLTDAEFDLMRDHTSIGSHILSGGSSRLLAMAEEIARAHHERWDGRGYPQGLAGERIPLAARIVAVADVLDALTHERPYKRAWSNAEALEEIRRQSGHQFDPRVVDACLRAFGGESGPALVVEADPRSLPRGRGGRLADEVHPLASSRREARASARRLQEVTFFDPLTELGNRHAFHSDLSTEIIRARRHGDTVGVAFIALDQLKRWNHRAGPERGAALLRRFAQCLQRQLRGLGRCYRSDGSEFAAILLHSRPGDADAVLARVDAAVAELRAIGFADLSAGVALAVFPDESAELTALLHPDEQRRYPHALHGDGANGSRADGDGAGPDTEADGENGATTA